MERRDDQQLVNFDLLIENTTPKSYRLVAIKLLVFDRSGKLELARELNENGKPPALEMIGERILQAGAVIDVYQPFYEFGPNIDPSRLHLEFLFVDSTHRSLPVALTADAVVSIDVRPRQYAPDAYCLPLHGLTIVHDGHDFYSHHRRYNLSERYKVDPRSALAANLYAYDFMRTTPEGLLFKGDARKKEHWLSYGEPVFAPADGVVVDSVSDVPDNTFDDFGEAISPSDADTRDPAGMGNYVTIQHTDGRVSWMLHLQPGSVRVRARTQVRAGQIIGNIGFTGDSLFPHLHYTVTDALIYPSQGVPSYFRGFSQILGARRIHQPTAQVDTGDLIESDASCPRRLLGRRSR